MKQYGWLVAVSALVSAFGCTVRDAELWETTGGMGLGGSPSGGAVTNQGGAPVGPGTGGATGGTTNPTGGNRATGGQATGGARSGGSGGVAAGGSAGSGGRNGGGTAGLGGVGLSNGGLGGASGAAGTLASGRAGAGGQSGGGGAGEGGAGGVGVECGDAPITIDGTGTIDAKTNGCGIQGYWWVAKDQGTTTLTSWDGGSVPYIAGRGLCLTGTAAIDTADAGDASWGVEIGFSLNYGSAWDATAHGVIGFEVVLKGTAGLSPLRALYDLAMAGPNAQVPVGTPGTNRVLIADAMVPVWVSTTPSLRADPTSLYNFKLHVDGNKGTDFDVCIESIKPLVASGSDSGAGGAGGGDAGAGGGDAGAGGRAGAAGIGGIGGTSAAPMARWTFPSALLAPWRPDVYQTPAGSTVGWTNSDPVPCSNGCAVLSVPMTNADQMVGILLEFPGLVDLTGRTLIARVAGRGTGGGVNVFAQSYSTSGTWVWAGQWANLSEVASQTSFSEVRLQLANIGDTVPDLDPTRIAGIGVQLTSGSTAASWVNPSWLNIDSVWIE